MAIMAHDEYGEARGNRRFLSGIPWAFKSPHMEIKFLIIAVRDSEVMGTKK